ncbi:MAG: MFS transporter, partial [Sphingopyxis sp.]
MTNGQGGISAQRIMDDSAMTMRQVLAVAIMVGLNALDGFDVLAISFASPGIAREWQIDRTALGFVLSMELIGMAVGSILLGRLADRIGRRPTILGCLVVMAIGMIAATRATSVVDLSVWRVLTGLGIGGMLAAINAAAAEFSNARHRSICMALMVVGYPIGSVIGGTISSVLLRGGDWRVVFEVGAIATIAFLPLVWWLVPETPAYIDSKRRGDTLARLNASLAALGHAPRTALASPAAGAGAGGEAGAGPGFPMLFSPAYRATTLLITAAYFFHII